MENELFGYVRVALTGASLSQPGLIHEADGCTLDKCGGGCEIKLLRLMRVKKLLLYLDRIFLFLLLV
jgi:transcriptional regulator with GAF, ATPase, and Fis domain